MKLHTRDEAIANARKIMAARYPDALFGVAAGSIIRGDNVFMSDLDLTVICESRECAFRESFIFDGMPVEAFVHDVETIQVFVDGDYASAHPIMVHMLATGIVVPEETADSRLLRRYAQSLLDKGPEEFPREKIDYLRYIVSDMIDDLKGGRPPEEQRAVLYKLYGQLSELHLRKRGRFARAGKHLARELRRDSPDFFAAIDSVMVAAHKGGIGKAEIATLEKLLADEGGYLFDGYTSKAPPDKRKEAIWRKAGG